MSVLTAIRERFSGRQASAESQYNELVKSSAAGGDVDFDSLANVLSLTYRTMETFIADVERIERRAAAHLKLKEVERLQKQHEAASSATGEAADAVDVARKAAEKLVDDALSNLRDKSDVSTRLSWQIGQLRQQAREDLLATADPSLQEEIDRLEARARVLTEQNSNVGRGPNCDPTEVIKVHHEYNREIAEIQSRIEELRAAQVA